MGLVPGAPDGDGPGPVPFAAINGGQAGMGRLQDF